MRSFLFVLLQLDVFEPSRKGQMSEEACDPTEVSSLA
jgi:hypothetical protein